MALTVDLRGGLDDVLRRQSEDRKAHHYRQLQTALRPCQRRVNIDPLATDEN